MDQDLVLLLLRVTVGATLVAHGLNHWRGPGGIDGTARWFGGIGLQPAKVHAWMSVGVELAAGIGLVLGLLTPFGAAAALGTMTVAGVAAHRKNGFFVFKDGYEYVLLVAVVCVALCVLGPGGWSLDRLLDVDDELSGAGGLVLAGLGPVGAALLLLACWRPAPVEVEPAA